MKLTKKLDTIVSNAFKAYETPVKITPSVSFRVDQLTEQIVAYKFSKYQNQPETNRPFFQVIDFVTNLENRAVAIQEKNLDVYADDADYVFSMIYEKELREEFDYLRIGDFLKDFQESKTDYGTAIVMVSDCDNEIGYKLEVVDFPSAVVDPFDIENGVKIFPHYLDFVQLEEKKEYWDADSIDELIYQAEKAGETRVNVYHIDGIMRETDIIGEGDDKYAFYEVYVGEVANGKRHYLYHTKLDEKRVYTFNREDRPKNKGGLGIGAIEEVLPEQMWINDIVITMHDAFELGSKIFGKTNKKGVDPIYAQQSGSIIELDSSKGEDFTFTTPNMPQVDWFRFIDGWLENLRRKASAHEAITGEEAKAGTPYSGQALQSANASSLFNYRRQKDASDIRWIEQNIIEPRIIARINREHTLNGSYSPAQKRIIDDYFINEKLIDLIEERDGFVLPEEIEAERLKIQEELAKKGDRRQVYIPSGFFTKENIAKKIRYYITSDMDDVQNKINNLTAQVASLTPDNPARDIFIRQIMELSGQSPAEYLMVGASGNIKPQGNTGLQAQINQVTPEGQA